MPAPLSRMPVLTRLLSWIWKPAMIALIAVSALGTEEGRLLDGGHSLLPNSTHSPDGRLGVTVVVLERAADLKDPKNQIVEVATGRVLADLRSRWPACDRSNHGGYDAAWSKDGTLLRWTVEGKWFCDALFIAKLKDQAVVWHKDLVPDCQKTILKLLKAKAPKAYAREKEANKGHGEAYPEGFSVDVRTEGEDLASQKLPLTVHVDLTSDVKGLHPKEALDAWLDAVLNEDGKLTFGALHLERRPELKNAWAY